jgi:hypothetical protein
VILAIFEEAPSLKLGVRKGEDPMVRALTTTSVALLLLFAALPARAADPDGAFGDRGEFIISADRLMGLLDYTSTKLTEQDNSSGSVNYTSFSLLQNPTGTALSLGGAGAPAIIAPYNVPRLSFDYTVVPHVTVGGSFVVFYTPGASTTETGTNGVSVTADTTKVSLFGIAPRVGYILNIGRLFSFWPRGGISVYSLHTSTPENVGQQQVTSSSTANELMVNIEPMFVFTPVSHFGVTAGPVFDLPIVGAVKNTETTNGVSVSQPGEGMTLFHFGISIGILGYI